MTVEHGKLKAFVLFLHPKGMTRQWVESDLWSSAAAIPGVSVIADDGGAEAKRFGCNTSGEVALYAANGELLFTGGITASRGHIGDNDGSASIISLVNNEQPRVKTSAVFGCPLNNPQCDARTANVATN